MEKTTMSLLEERWKVPEESIILSENFLIQVSSLIVEVRSEILILQDQSSADLPLSTALLCITFKIINLFL